MRLPAALLLLLASTTAPQAAPNIVVIMTDDQEDTGSMAYMPKTHELLAEKGGPSPTASSIFPSALRVGHRS
jgi:hypothetical protein